MTPSRIPLRLQVYFSIIICDGQPCVGAGGEASAGGVIPVVRRARRVSGEVHVVVRVALVARCHIHGVLPANVAVPHANLLSLVRDGDARKEHVQPVETVHHVGSEPRRHPWLVVVSELQVKRSDKR